jgi:tetratricopeptide (TPR) repeat protein
MGVQVKSVGPIAIRGIKTSPSGKTIVFVVSLLALVTGTAAAPNWELKTKEQLLDEEYGTGIYRYTYDEYAAIANDSKEYYVKANAYRDKKDYANALKNYEIALSMFDWGAFYYQYGVCLMDTQDYQNAEKSFKKAIRKIPYYDPYTIIAPYYHKSGRNTIYTFDHNGIVRETYFSYYNLACIYSLTNKLTDSYNHLKLAIESGYLYLDHIFTDTDLANLFNAPNAAQMKDEINRLYAAGTRNTVSGKTYERRLSPNDFVDYEFTDGANIKVYQLTSDDRDMIMYGTYAIKNYHIIITYNRVTGREGRNPLPGGGMITPYEYYVPYDRPMNETEYISLKDMAEDDWEWKEK